MIFISICRVTKTNKKMTITLSRNDPLTIICQKMFKIDESEKLETLQEMYPPVVGIKDAKKSPSKIRTSVRGHVKKLSTIPIMIKSKINIENGMLQWCLFNQSLPA